MEIIKPRTLSGFMELLPSKQIQFEKMAEILRTTYASYGFAPLDTPVIEDAQILLAKGGGETEKQIYRFTKGDSDLALRFDLTVPLAKYVALHYNELAFPFRRFQISKVYRGERAQRGRFREFYQADIDIIGDGKLDILNEAEIPAIIYKVFRGFGLTRFQIHVNNRKILNGFYAMLGLSEKSGDIMRTVDKLDKIGPEKVKLILLEDCGLTESQEEEILTFIAIKGTNAEVLAALEGYAGRNETFDLGLSELKAVCSNLAAFGVPEANFAVDLTIARGLDYYTGTVYETTLLDHPEIGSVCSGGRYDNLAGYYIDKQLCHGMCTLVLPTFVYSRVIMPSPYAVAALPRTFHYLIWSTAFHVPDKSLFLFFRQYLAEDHSLVFSFVKYFAVVVHVGGNLHSCIADRIERQYRHIEIDKVRVVSVYGIECTIVEIGDISLRRNTRTIFPTPLSMYDTVIPCVVAEVVVLCVKILWVKSLPPFLRAVGIGLISVILREPSIIFHTSHIAFKVEAT